MSEIKGSNRNHRNLTIWTPFVLFSAIVHLSSPCSLGCLMCDLTLQKCLICDWKNSFQLSKTGTCFKTLNNECLIPDSNKQGCLQCNQFRFPDPYSLNCLEVPKALRIPNCLFYTHNKQCRKCEPSYVATGYECIKIEPIEHCNYHISNRMCGECEPGYGLSLDLTLCEIESEKECRISSKLDCAACANGLPLNQESFFKSKPMNAILHTVKWPLLEPTFRELRNYSCSLPKLTEKCIAYDSFGYCTKCELGYGIDISTRFCVKIEPAIDSCKIYSSLTSCSECENNFFLQSPSMCSPIIPIEGCEEYDGTASQSLCKLCSDSHYLLSSNTCVAREKSKQVLNCTQLSPIQDECLTCGNGYQISGQGLKCLKNMSECQEYLDIDSEKDFLTCVRCNKGYFYSSQEISCQKGTIMNCEIFEQFSDKCHQCGNGFLRSENGGCVPHNFIARCEKYSNEFLNKCDKCVEPHLLLTFDHVCQPFSPIAFCVEYNGKLCSKCSKGYKLENGFCSKLSLPLNCSEGSDHGICTRCVDFFYLNKISDTQVNCVPATTSEKFSVLKNNPSAEKFEILGCQQNSFYDQTPSFSALCWNNSDPSHIDFKTHKFISNCQIYFKKSPSEIICLQCKDYFYLWKNRCVSDCQIHPSIDFLPGVINNQNLSQFRVCDESTHYVGSEKSLNDPLLNCQKTSRNYLDLDDPKMYCSMCKSNSNIFSVLNPSKLTKPIATLNGPKATSFHPLSSHLLGLECLDKLHIQSKLTQEVAHCAVYEVTKHNDYACLACDFGYVAKIKSFTIKSQTRDFIEECDPFPSCNSSSKYSSQGLSTQLFGSLNFPLSSAVTCHECKDSSQHLVLFGTVKDKMIIPSGYSDMVSNNQKLDQGRGGPHMSCMSYEGLETIFSSLVLVSSCAIHFVNVKLAVKSGNVNETQSSSSLGVHCLACKNGYKPTFGNNPHSNLKIVIDCTPISNCNLVDPNSPKIFNNCGQCNANSMRKSETSKMFFDECVSVATKYQDPNCIAFDTNSSYCALCAPGYALGPEGLCDVLSYLACTQFGQPFNEPNISELPSINTEYPTIKDFSLYFKLMTHPTRGCQSCAEGYSAVLQIPKLPICTLSQNFKNKKYTPVVERSKIIANCYSHSQNSSSETICYQCEDNFIPMKTKKVCVLKNKENTNCSELLSDSPLKCSLCTANTVLVNGSCMTHSIQNCNKVAPDLVNSKVICQNCAQGHYFDSSSESCKPGQVPNCDEYNADSPTHCKRCAQSHLYIPSKEQKERCVYIPHSDCLDLSQSGESLVCNKCPPFTYLVSTPSNKNPSFSYQTSVPLTVSHCLPKVAIPNCIAYSANPSLDQSATTCSKCSSNFYLASTLKSCILRQKRVAHCLIYSSTSENCMRCYTGFLYQNGNCLFYPSSAQNCLYFKDTQECSQCIFGYYLDRGKCYQANILQNCLVHSQGGFCLQCKPGFQLQFDNKTCKAIPISNCIMITPQQPEMCLKCQANYIESPLFTKLWLEDIEVTKQTGANCLPKNDIFCESYINNLEQVCSKCVGDYALDPNFKCKILPITTLHCAVQDSDQICRRCKRSFYLSEDRKSCIPLTTAQRYLIDPLCSNIKMVSERKCTFCQSNISSSISSSECFQCSILSLNYLTKLSIMDLNVKLGFLLSSQEDLKLYFQQACEICSLTECIICKPGFYMDSTGLCHGSFAVGQKLIEEDEVVFDNPFNYKEEFEGDATWGYLPVIMLILLLAFFG